MLNKENTSRGRRCLFSETEIGHRIAEEACSRIIAGSVTGEVDPMDFFEQELDSHGFSHLFADQAFICLEHLLASNLEACNQETKERLQTVMGSIETAAVIYFYKRITRETKSLHVADVLVEAERLLEETAFIMSTAYVEALEGIRRFCEKKIERDRKRAKIREELKILAEPEPSTAKSEEYNPEKRGLTRQLAMLLMDELFPDLKRASKKAKAEFLELLTGFSADGLRNKWVDYQRGNPQSLAQDRVKVDKWKKRLGLGESQEK